MREVRITVVGVGGAGCNAVSRLYKSNIQSAKTVAINTDALHLQQVAQAHEKILIGKSITGGLGAGGDPAIAKKCAEADYDVLKKMLQDNSLVFIAAGMGGGTGTGAAPVVARAAKEAGAIVVGVVTYPFKIERSRLEKALEGIDKLSKECHTLIVIDNNKLLEYVPNLPIDKAFEVADSIINRAVRGIADAIALPSLISMDYADLEAVMRKGGLAMISIGEGAGPLKVEEAIKSTLQHPLLEVNYEGAHGALLHIEGGEDLTIGDAIKVADAITQNFDPDAEVKLGARINPELQEKMIVTAIIVGVRSPYIKGKEGGDEEPSLDLDSF